MKLSQSIWQTYKEIPKEAEIASHQLLLRAGLVHKSVAGIFHYLPFALKVIQKIEQIIREEHNKIGCQEITMSVLTNADVWKESGRWDEYGPEMLRIKDRGDRDLCFSPTNEEAVTDIFRRIIKSYKQLPQTLYQINTKFRDEIRPRFGMLRGREFTMKDAYSFHIDKASLDVTYDKMYQVYKNIFDRIGLEYMVVEADAGAMADSSNKTHEFQLMAANGEDDLVYTETGTYAANREKAETKRKDLTFDTKEQKSEKVLTENAPTIKSVCELLATELYHSIKVLIYKYTIKDKDDFVLVSLLGDDEINELKLKNHLNADFIQMATDNELKELGLIKGYIGPQDHTGIKILVDKAVDTSAFYVVGANEENYHLKGFHFSMLADYELTDLRLSQNGDISLSDGNPVIIKKGIEVGHIFQLGDKYTNSMQASVLDQNGQAITPLMGCYGIGVTRVFQAAIEQSHDEKGIVWTKSISPFAIHFVQILKSEALKEKANELYEQFQSNGLDVLMDDRKLSPGIKFKDADLLGVPIQVVMGQKNYENSKEFEVILRKTGEKILVKEDELISKLKSLWDSLS